MPFEEGAFERGWVLESMTPVDPKSGKPKGGPVPIREFSAKYDVSSNSIKTAITAALGALADVSWVDKIPARKGIKFMFIYLGKFGLEFKGDIYTPIFKLPVKQEGEDQSTQFNFGKTGNSFWLAAEEIKTPEGKEVLAHSIYVLPDDTTDEELRKISINAVHSSQHKRFMSAKEFQWRRDMEAISRGEEPKRKEVFKEEPLSEERHKLQFEVIKHPSAKNFFIVFKYGTSEEDIVRSAKKAVTGQIELSDVKVFRGKPEKTDTKVKREYGDWLKLEPGVRFWYENVDPSNKYMTLGFNELVIVNSEKPTETENFKKVEVKNPKLPPSKQNFILKIKPGDVIKIMDTKQNKISKVRVMKAAHTTQNLYRLALEYLS